MNSENKVIGRWIEWHARNGDGSGIGNGTGTKTQFFRRCAEIKQTFNGNNENHNRRRHRLRQRKGKNLLQSFWYLKFIRSAACCRHVSLPSPPPPKNDCLVRPPFLRATNARSARGSATHISEYTELNCSLAVACLIGVSSAVFPRWSLCLSSILAYSIRTTMMMTIITTTNIWMFRWMVLVYAISHQLQMVRRCALLSSFSIHINCIWIVREKERWWRGRWCRY